MCAISGMINLPASEKTVRQMLETMHRRGPDDRGVYREKGCTLLHGRLAIIDPEGGRQPMTLAWAGEEYTLVYDGELYDTGAAARGTVRPWTQLSGAFRHGGAASMPMPSLGRSVWKS